MKGFPRWALTALLAVLLVLPPAALAEDNCDRIQGFLTPENQLQVFLSGDGEGLPEQFTAALGGAAVPVTRAGSAAGQPVTYYCLTDVSGSLTEEQLNQEKEVLKAVSARLSTGDRMVIGRLGNTVVPTGYLWDRTTIDAEIDALTVKKEDTNLYGGIVSAVQELVSSTNVTVRKCLILLSDGKDDQVASFTREEADRAILDARIPVYTVAAMRTATRNDAQSVEYAKILGSFARESTGGVYYNPILDGTSASSAGADIVENLRHDLLLTLDLSGLDPSLLSQQSLLFRLRWTAGGAAYEDTMELDPARLNVTAAAQTPAAEVNESTFFYVRMAVAGLLVLAAVLLLLSGRKRRPVPPSAEPEPGVRTPGREPAPPETPGYARTPAPAVEPYPHGQVRAVPAGRPVTFTAIGYENIRFTLRLPEGQTVTIGRDRRADRILNPEDTRLSGVHFRAELGERALRVRDAGSTNGTAVNGVPLSGGNSALVEDGQTVRAGSYDYRVHIGEREA